MALTQFNEWEPRLDPVTGIEAQEPRVFAHDAVAVVIGAINNSHSNHGITMTSDGSGYAVDMVLTMTGGTGTGAEITVTAIGGAGATGPITDYTVSNVGSGYVVGDNLTQSGASAPAGGTGFTCTVSNIDIPNTQKRGACIYVGAAIASLVVEMESGNTATFKSISAGSILPLLIKRVVSGISASNDVIALY